MLDCDPHLSLQPGEDLKAMTADIQHFISSGMR